MRFEFRSVCCTILCFVALLDFASTSGSRAWADGKIVVANRGSGTISIIDAESHQLTATVSLPPGANAPEPMYVVNTRFPNRVWVGDRANNQVVVMDGDSFAVVKTVPCGAGVFHMWADAFGQELWVVNDIDKTCTVVDARRMKAVATIPMPEDLVVIGARPHDVVLDPFGFSAYVTMINVNPQFDVIVQFCTWTGEELNRAEVGKDPHVSFNWRTWEVYSPCQNSNAVLVLDACSLNITDQISVPGAHGAVTSPDGKRFYTTNIPGLGVDAVFCIDARSNGLVGMPADTPYTTPHNLALTSDGRKLFVTHSGANNKVSVCRIRRDGSPQLMGEVTVGNNPFGLAFVR